MIIFILVSCHGSHDFHLLSHLAISKVAFAGKAFSPDLGRGTVKCLLNCTGSERKKEKIFHAHLC